MSHQEKIYSLKSELIFLGAKTTVTHALRGVNSCISVLFYASEALLRGPLQYRIEVNKRETICQLTERFLRIIKEIITKFERMCGNLAELFGAKL